jgi:hypothetical protein
MLLDILTRVMPKFLRSFVKTSSCYHTHVFIFKTMKTDYRRIRYDLHCLYPPPFRCCQCDFWDKLKLSSLLEVSIISATQCRRMVMRENIWRHYYHSFTFLIYIPNKRSQHNYPSHFVYSLLCNFCSINQQQNPAKATFTRRKFTRASQMQGIPTQTSRASRIMEVATRF